MTDYHPEHTEAIEELTRQLNACDTRMELLEAALERALHNLPNIAHANECPVQQRHSTDCNCWIHQAWILLSERKD